MRPEAIQIIKDEHLAIAAVLYCLRYIVKEVKDEGKAPDFVLLRAILDYIVSYPDRWHHPKEDKYLFAAVRARGYSIDEGENEEADPTFKSRIARLQRYYARKEKKHEERLEEIFADMKIQRESLDEEAERLSQEVENLRVFRKKLVAEIESADE